MADRGFGDSFEEQAQASRRGILMEAMDWLGHNKKWWLLPIVLAILCLGALVMLGGGGALSPFIYSLF